MDEKLSPDSVQVSLDSLLEDVRSLLDRQKVIEALVSRQEGPKQQLLQIMTERQHLAEMQRRLASRHPADLAFLLQSLPVDERLRVWNQVWPIHGGAILLELSSPIRKVFLNSMSREDVVALLRQVGSDDLADLAEDVSRDILEEVYATLDSQSQSWLVSSIAYPQESVGQLMSQKVITVKPERTAHEIVEELRGKDLPRLMDMLYVIDSRHTLIGLLPVTKLLLADPQILPAIFSWKIRL